MSRSTFDRAMPWLAYALALLVGARFAMDIPGAIGVALVTVLLPLGILCIGKSAMEALNVRR